MKKVVISFIIASFTIVAHAQDAIQIIRKADSLTKEGNYTEAIALLRNNETLFEEDDELGFMYCDLSFYYLFTKDFKRSEQAAQAARQALKIDSILIVGAEIRLAHALLFQRKINKAEKIYNKLETTYWFDITALLEDFEKLEKANVVPKNAQNDFERIKKRMEKSTMK